MPTDPPDPKIRGHCPPPSSRALPTPSSRGPLRPPYSLPSLLHLSQSSQILFRVHDPSSSSSSLLWTGLPSSSGFTAANLNLAYLAPLPYSKVYNSASLGAGTRWAEGKYIRHTILDHVLGKEKQSCLPTVTSIDERPDTPEDEKTPWISSSMDLFWCLYEVVRRLVALETKKVDIAVIKHPHRPKKRDPSPRPEHDQADTASEGEKDLPITSSSAIREEEIDQNTHQDEPREDVREIMIDPYPLLRLSHPKVKDLLLSVGMRENYEIAARATRHTTERLFWGRIFTSSILYNMEFTMKQTPLEMPEQFYKPRSKTQTSTRKAHRSDGWTDNLVWDPRIDAFDIAYRKVLERRRGMAKLAGEELPNRPL